MIDPSVVRRLAFIKYLYRVATEQSQAPEPLAAASLLTFHDAVELFLQLASEHMNVGSRQTHFMKYWPLLAAKLPPGTELAQKESMRRLNKARVALKHHGTLPSRLDVESFRASATAFFSDNTPIVFELTFDEISLTDFVRPEEAKSKLKSAEQHLLTGQFDMALEEVAVAFAQVIDDYEQRKRDSFGRSPFFFGRDLKFHSSFLMGIDRDGEGRKLAEFIDRVKESIDAMQTAIKVLALGLDYRRYSRFQLHAPYVNRSLGGTYHPYRKLHQCAIGPTREDVQYCIDFVVEMAIRLQEFDYDIPAPSHGT